MRILLDKSKTRKTDQSFEDRNESRMSKYKFITTPKLVKITGG